MFVELLEDKQRLMVYITPESSLFDAIETLHDNKVHRLLVIDDHLGNPLNLLSHKRIAKFLHQHVSQKFLMAAKVTDNSILFVDVMFVISFINSCCCCDIKCVFSLDAISAATLVYGQDTGRVKCWNL